MTTFPNQRVSRDKKNEKTFYQPTYDYLINKAINLNDKTQVISWMNAANGKVETGSLDYLISPLLKDDGKPVGKLPGEVRQTEIINTIREKSIGEYVGLPYKFDVIVQNSDAILRRDAEVRKELINIAQIAVINELNKQYEKAQQQGEDAINTGMPTIEIPNIEDFTRNIIENWLDARAIKGQHILQYINSINNFDILRLQNFLNWWTTEQFYTYREIINGEVRVESISAIEGYPIPNGEQFVEDYDGFVIIRQTTLTKIKQLYWNEFTEDDKTYLKSLVESTDGRYKASPVLLLDRTLSSAMRSNYASNLNGEFYFTDNGEVINEYITIWRTEVPTKIRKYIDYFGKEQSEIVKDDYIKTEDDISVEESWHEEVYIGRRFGQQDMGVYLKPKPCPVQRYDKHLMRPKLPVGGKYGILNGILLNPIPKRLITYELLDEMFTLQIERTIAKYRSHITVIPNSMLAADESGTAKDKMFYLLADNTILYDDSKVDVNVVAQAFRVVGMTPVADYLRTLLEIRREYRNEALSIANMNDPKLGNIAPSMGKGVVQESIFRASLGNVLSITMFNAALERDHMADLEFSKVAYIEGKEINYFDQKDRKSINVTVDPIEHLETDYGVSVINAKIEEEKKNAYRQFAFNASQNGDFELAVPAIEADSIAEIKVAVRKVIEAKKKLEAEIEQQRNDTQRYVTDTNKAVADEANQVAITRAQIAADASITVAQINAESKNIETDTTIPDDNSDINSIVDRSFKERKLLAEQVMHKEDSEDRNKELQFKKEKLKIDRTNKKSN